MTSETVRRALTASLAVALVAVVGACGGETDSSDNGGVVESTTTTVAPMTFAECQKQGEYPGGRYAVSFENGVCTVQKPTETTVAVTYPNCAAVRAAGKAPLHIGDPGYSAELDRDGDGTACDS